MNLIFKILLPIILLFSVQSVTGKIYYTENAKKIKQKGFIFTLKQMDSSDNFTVLKSQNVGTAQLMNQFFSPSGKYMVVYLTRKKKEKDELVIYLTKDFSEILRKEVKIPSFYYGSHIKPFFNDDESIIALQLLKSKKNNVLNAYVIEGGYLLYSKPLEKKSMLFGQSSTKNTLYIGGKAGVRGYSSIEVIDINNGESLNKMAKKYAKYKYMPTIQSNLFIADYAGKKHNFEIIVLNNDTGKSVLRENTGNVSPVFTTKNNMENVYFVNNFKNKLGFEINQLKDNKIDNIARIDTDIKPVFFAASNKLDRFIVASTSNFILVDTESSKVPKRISSPFDIATGYFSADDSLVYLREGTGSEVGVIDFNQQKIINESGTGRKSVKFGLFMATVALGAASGYYTGYINVSYSYTDTAMLLSRDEQRLYVVNSRTNDVTLFDAKDLSGRKGIATGSGTFGVFQLKHEYYPEQEDSNVFVISPSSISYFNQFSLDIIKKIDFKTFINFDVEENLLFTKDKQDNVNIYKLSTGAKIRSIEKAETLMKINYYIEPQG
jgi:hypothetical protein